VRVLVIGGTRFIGAHTVRRLVAAGAEVTVLHRGQSESAALPVTVAHVRDPAAEYPITRFPAALIGRDWDVVVHMVMMGRADAQAACDAFAGQAGRMVMISSGDVYRAYGRLTGFEPGPVERTPLTEESLLRTRLYPYRAMAKQLGAYAQDYEKILAERVTGETRTPSVILRLPKVYGPEDNASLATVYGFAAQPQWRWTHGHVGNVARAIELAATHPKASGIYNVGEAHTPTMGERLEQLPAAKESPAKPPPFDFAQDMAVDTTRIRTELGYADVVDEAEAMRALAEAR
jgi:nucleoside-diphosphate-sugar epimerase